MLAQDAACGKKPKNPTPLFDVTPIQYDVVKFTSTLIRKSH